MDLPEEFLALASIYQRNGHSLYMVGGTSRDYLLGGFCRDFDLVGDATPSEAKVFLNGEKLNVDLTFARFGTIKVKFMGQSIDVATFREEGEYNDSRHPSFIRFIKSMEIDSKRRDFTINALYVDALGKVYDFHGGMEDMENRLIRFIGDPYVRIKEDPLRILRGERFASRLGFQIEEKSLRAMNELRGELDKLNPEKVTMEKKKR